MSKWRKIHRDTLQIEAKASANYLNGYLARKDAIARGYDIGIMLSTDGLLAEGSRESIFVVRDGVLKVPPAGSVLSSITRMSILEGASTIGVVCDTNDVTRKELFAADEMFAASTSLKVLPVARFENRELPAPGPVTAWIDHLMKGIVRFENERFADWFQPLAHPNVTDEEVG